MIAITRLNFTLYVHCRYCSKHTVIVSLYGIHRLAFVVEAHCVFCKVRTEMLHIMWISFSLQRPCHGSCLRPLTAEAHILFWATQYKIYGGQNGTMTGFSSGNSVFLCQSQTNKNHYLSASTRFPDRMDKVEAWEP